MKNKRIIIGIILIAIFILLMLYSGLEYNNHKPTIAHIIENYETYNNTKISFSGIIEQINITNQQIIISIQWTPIVIEVKKDLVKDKIQKGDLVEILGILKGKYHVKVEKIMIVEKWKSDLIIIRSLPAIPFALYLFFRTWHFNKKTYRFERRNKNA